MNLLIKGLNDGNMSQGTISQSRILHPATLKQTSCIECCSTPQESDPSCKNCLFNLITEYIIELCAECGGLCVYELLTKMNVHWNKLLQREMRALDRDWNRASLLNSITPSHLTSQQVLCPAALALQQHTMLTKFKPSTWLHVIDHKQIGRQTQ